MPINYEVKQGDCISSIAFAHGFFPDTIWNHADNKDLKEKRKDPNVLMPGDVVFVPDKRIKEVAKPTNQVHNFRVKNTPKILKIRFVNFDTPVKAMDYEIEIGGVKKQGKTDGDGWLTQFIPPGAELAKLVFADGAEYELRLGSLDPVDEITGLQGRLSTLGLYEGPINGELNDETTSALEAFQNLNDLEVTGKPDNNTRHLLTQMTGK